MISTPFFKKLQKNYGKHNSERRQIINISNGVLHDSKRVIFALHRGDSKAAQASLVVIEKTLKDIEKKFGFHRLREEGAYNDAVEEYVEARLFFEVVKGGEISEIKGITLSTEAYLGGICDVTGELVRHATNAAARQDFNKVKRAHVAINEIMAALVEFDMTGYLRNKYDQAKQGLRKIEQISYEVNLRF